MTVKVTERRMDPCLIVFFKRIFHDLYQEQRILIGWCDDSRFGILFPQLPCLQIHEGLDVNCSDVQIPSVFLIKWGHFFGEGNV